MERIALASSSLASAQYDATTEALEIEFRDGRIYHYAGVPLHTYEQLMEAASKGQFFNLHIRDVYPFVRVG
jgi:KTSC domain